MNPAEANPLYRMLPSVNDVLLKLQLSQPDLLNGRRERATQAIRRILDDVRNEIAQGLHTSSSIEQYVGKLPASIAEEMRSDSKLSLRRVINATGVLLHTNLGRAPLSEMALRHLHEVAAGYSNLEFDLEQGGRGRRDSHVESLLLALFAAKALHTQETRRAVVVNNCAAATFLALHALAKGRHVLVSRAELIEIGGGFRIPEILEESGAFLKEVGTTNRTRVSDYDKAITPDTALILRVHQSNFSMEGFVERPGLDELVALSKRKGVGVFEDQGTGLVESLEPHGIRGEATVAGSLISGCDLVAASGDKLFGGPQCGILIGQKEWIDRIRSNPLFRTFRADKLSYAALEATLMQYLEGDRESIPVIRMLRVSQDAIRDRCARIADSVHAAGLSVTVLGASSVIGGGTAPSSTLPSYAVALQHEKLNASAVLAALRNVDTPVIGRIDEDRVLLDLRTVEPEFDDFLIHALSQPFASSQESQG